MARNDEKVKELLELVEKGTKDVFESDKYKNYLSTMSKFHKYSFRNSMLILLQRPDATLVAGYTAWQQKFKRQVQRGEKGIRIIGYTPHNKEIAKKDSSGNVIYDDKGEVVTETKQVPGFSTVYVYDVSQTDGEPLPNLLYELDGNLDNYEMLQQAITDISPIPIVFEPISGDTKGYCTPDKIAVKEGMSNIHTIKTMIHEITHGDLHMPEKDLPIKEKTDRLTREIEAESTAFVVCSHYGIDTSEYSFPYLASWSSSRELTELQNSLERIQKQAGELIDRIDSRLEELQKSKELQHNNLQVQAAPTQLAEKIVNYLEEVDFTQAAYHEKQLTDFTGMLLSDKPQPIIEMLKERAHWFPQETNDVNNLISEIIDYTKIPDAGLLVPNKTSEPAQNTLQAQEAPTKLAEKIANLLGYTHGGYHEKLVADYTKMLLSDDLKPIIDTLHGHALYYPEELNDINNLISEIKDYAPEEKIELFIQEKDVNRYLDDIRATLPVEQSPFARSGSTIKIDEETGELVSSKRNMKDPSQWTDREVALFTIETDIQLFGSIQDATWKALHDAGFVYTNGKLIEQSKTEQEQRQNEILDSIKFDNDIDLDKEKSREQLGFKDDMSDTAPKRASMKDRMAAAQEEANKRNNASEKRESLKEKEERGM